MAEAAQLVLLFLEQVRVDGANAQPNRVADARDRLLDEVGRKSKETEIRVATRKRGLANTLTNRRGVVEGFKRGNLLAEKERTEKDLSAWIAAGPQRQKKYGDVLAGMNAIQLEKEKTRDRDVTLNDLVGMAAVASEVLVLDQDQVHPKPIPGAENTAASFFSPDGKNIGFLTGFPGALKVVAIDGGVPRTLGGWARVLSGYATLSAAAAVVYWLSPGQRKRAALGGMTVPGPSDWPLDRMRDLSTLTHLAEWNRYWLGNQEQDD